MPSDTEVVVVVVVCVCVCVRMSLTFSLDASRSVARSRARARALSLWHLSRLRILRFFVQLGCGSAAPGRICNLYLSFYHFLYQKYFGF